MSSPANATLPMGSAQPLSVLDIFLPGLTHALAIVDQLLAGELSYYAYFMCLIGVFMYLGKYIRKLASWLEPYFSQFPRPCSLMSILTPDSFNDPCPAFRRSVRYASDMG
jgi:hypothetical protein